MHYFIDGRLFTQLVSSGLKSLSLSRDRINDLNVFPVPDGDTGTNMCMTLLNGLNALSDGADEDLDMVAAKFSQGIVLGARGNSGVILSQFFKGICAHLSTLKKADVTDLCNALALGVTYAYKAVLEPVEGTMLTVIREATEYVSLNVKANGRFSVDDVISYFLIRARRSLENTPELLDVLKKADVIDSGGAGIVSIFEGMEMFLSGEPIDGEIAAFEPVSVKSPDYSLITPETEYVYGYCTELLVQLKSVSVFDANKFSDDLSSLGESIVVSEAGGKVKIHIHTFKPEQVLTYCHGYGEFLALKIENMDVQNVNEQARKAKAKNRERVRLATVVVSPDSKMSEIFTSMGANAVVEGGDTCNPSVGDFISAFQSVNADEILVYPNNSNVIMTAVQAAGQYSEANVTVVNCSSPAGCYSTLALIEYGVGAQENLAVIDDALKGVSTVLVTRSVKDAVFDGTTISEGEYISVEGKTLLNKGEDLCKVVCDTVAKKIAETDKEVVTLFVGKAVGKERLDRILECIGSDSPFIDVCTVMTDNSVHELLISLE